MSAAYTGGSKIAVGNTHMAVKSLVTPLIRYIIRGVDATEIIPQHINNRNFARSSTLQSVQAAPTPIVTAAPKGTAAT